jgi:hypothetical protein
MLITNWRELCEAVILTGDLDPLYDFTVAANKARNDLWTARFVTHLLTFYDVGGACHAADLTSEGSFWDYVISNYDHFPRGTNRRHSRGDIGRKYVANCEKIGSPSVFLEEAWAPNYTALVKKFQDKFHGCGYGPYFVWKVMDYQDRVLGRPVKLEMHEAVRHMPDEAKKGATLLWPDVPLLGVLSAMTRFLTRFTAPGLPNRQCGLSEAETMLCALRGWYNGDYAVGQDLLDRRKQLKSAPLFLEFLKPVPLTPYERPNPLDPKALSANLA